MVTVYEFCEMSKYEENRLVIFDSYTNRVVFNGTVEGAAKSDFSSSVVYNIDWLVTPLVYAAIWLTINTRDGKD